MFPYNHVPERLKRKKANGAARVAMRHSALIPDVIISQLISYRRRLNTREQMREERDGDNCYNALD